MNSPSLAEVLCHHYWVIQQPSGRYSEGVCKLCHGTRQFQNWLPESDFLTRNERRSDGFSESGMAK